MAAGPWEIAEILLKTFMYAATFGAAGGAIFLRQFADQMSDARCERIARLVGGCAVVGIVLSALRIPVLAGAAGGDITGMIDRPLLGMMVWGAEGRSTGVRMIGLAMAGVVVVKQPRGSFLAVAGAVLATTSFIWVGHSRSANPAGLAIVLVGIHLLGVAFWLGAFMPLFTIVRDPDTTYGLQVVRRFGRMAVLAVGSLVAGGLVLLWMLIGTPEHLWSSNYGRMFLVKLGLVAVLSGLAALNKWRWTPGIERHDARSAVYLRRSIAAEVVLAMLILLVTASFTTLTGPPV